MQEHTRNIGTTRSCVITNHDTYAHTTEATADDSSEHQVRREVDLTTEEEGRVERLDSLLTWVNQVVEDVHNTRREERCEDRATTKGTSKEDEGCKDKRHIEHIAECTNLNRWE